MTKKGMDKKSTMKDIVANPLLKSKVGAMIAEGAKLDDIKELCEEYDVYLSKPTLSRYQDKLRSAIEEGLDIEDVLDGREKKGNIVEIYGKRDTKDELDNVATLDHADSTQKQLFNNLDFLQELVDKSYNAIQYVDTITPAMGIKAIELMAKLTGNQMQGVSIAGIKHMKLAQDARNEAVYEVLFSYIPEEKHEEVLMAMEKAEEEYYKKLDLNDEDAKINQQLKELGL